MVKFKNMYCKCVTHGSLCARVISSIIFFISSIFWTYSSDILLCSSTMCLASSSSSHYYSIRSALACSTSVECEHVVEELLAQLLRDLGLGPQQYLLSSLVFYSKRSRKYRPQRMVENPLE